MYINGFYAPLIEMWVNDAEWESLMDDAGDMSEGDIVRGFKRVVDILRQLCTISGVPEARRQEEGSQRRRPPRTRRRREDREPPHQAGLSPGNEWNGRASCRKHRSGYRR